MDKEKSNFINSLSIWKLLLRIFTESISSSIIIMLVLFIARRDNFINSLTAYSFIFIIIFLFIFAILILIYFFRAKISSIFYDNNAFYIDFRWFNTKIILPISDLDKVIKNRIQRNIQVILVSKNKNKLSIWSNGFNKNEWIKFENILKDLNLIRN